MGTGKFIPTAVNIEKVLFTAVSQSDYLTNPDAILLTMGNYYVGGVQPDGKGDNVYVTTVSASSSALTVNPAILGESTYLDASVLLKEMLLTLLTSTSQAESRVLKAMLKSSMNITNTW